jgi:hypothetical protein
MGQGQTSEEQILALAREYEDLRATLRQIRARIDDEEERGRDSAYLTSLREEYGSGKRSVAEIREVLAPLEPATLDGIKAKAVVFASTDKGISLRRAVISTIKGGRRR